MAAVPVNKFLRIAILWLLLSSPYAYTGALGDSDSTCSGKCSCELGDSCRFTVDASTTVQVAYQLNQTTENQAIRVFVSSSDAVSAHPLLVNVRQPRAITSWALPYVEAGYSYSSVERTLCPLNNRDDDPSTARLLVDVSTSSASAVNFTLSASVVENFYLKLNEPATITASPSKPAYLQFSYPPSTSRVKVRFSSQDNTSRICAIASIQTTYCPVVELLDNPDHRGTFQTMRSTAAIDTRLTEQPLNSSVGGAFFYAVVTVFPSNEDYSACFSDGRGATDHLVTSSSSSSAGSPENSFLSPTVGGGGDREKRITITVVPALSDSGYAVAIVTATIVYMVFYFIAIIWIFFADYICYQGNSLYQFTRETLSNKKPNFIKIGDGGEAGEGGGGVEEVDSGGVDDGAKLKEELDTHINHDDDDRHGSPEPLTGGDSDHPDSPQLSFKRFFPHHGRQRYSSKMSTLSEISERESSPAAAATNYSAVGGAAAGSQHEALKRPSLFSVLVGSHLSVCANEVYVQSNPPSPRPHRRGSTSRPVRRHTSRSESHASHGRYGRATPESSLDVTQSLGLTAAGLGHRRTSAAQEAQMKKTKSLDHQLSSEAKDYDSIEQVDYELDSRETLGAQDSIRSTDTTNNGQVPGHVTVHVSESYVKAVSGEPDLQSKRIGGGHVTDHVSDHVTSRKNSYNQAMLAEQGLLQLQERVGSDNGDDIDSGGAVRIRMENGGSEMGMRQYRHDTDLLPVNLYISELEVREGEESVYAQKDYNHLYWYMITIIIFYGIPAFQLVITYQQLLNISGNEDLCYYNSLCSHPWRISSTLTLSALNSIISNIGYLILGFLFILIAYRRRTIYKAYEDVNSGLSKGEKLGVPQYFGIYYAIGLALMAEAFMSAAYHICPSNANYQYDTTFMFVLGGLGLFKLLESRAPDHNPPLYKILFLQAAIIVLAVVGVLYSTTLWLYILFFFVHMITTFIVTVEIYYRWQIGIKLSFVHIFQLIAQRCCPQQFEQEASINGDQREGDLEGGRGGEGGREGEGGSSRGEGERDGEGERNIDEDGEQALEKKSKQSIIQLFEMYRNEGLCPPKHKPKFAMAIVSNLLNLGFALYMVGYRPLDFGTNFLMILISNFLLYLLYYAITKCIYREVSLASFRPLVFFILSIIFWLIGVYGYLLAATDWLQPPAISRDGNRDCLMLDFFDSHDLWHFTSAFGLFFSFVMLMTLDDNQDGVPRNKIRVF